MSTVTRSFSMTARRPEGTRRFCAQAIRWSNNGIPGVKKLHTLKHNVLINLLCKILFLTDSVEGKRHDKKLADETTYVLPTASTLFQDTGFQGFSLSEVTLLQPKKKPRGNELTDLDKAVN